MFKIFNEKKIKNYFDENNQKFQKEIDNYSEREVLSLNVELTAQNLFGEYKITIPTFEGENRQSKLITRKQITSRLSTETDTLVEIEMAYYNVPFIGEGNLFRCKPSRASSGLYQAEELLENSITIQLTNEDIIIGYPESREKIDAKFSGFVDYLKRNLNSLNNDVTEYNNGLFINGYVQ